MRLLLCRHGESVFNVRGAINADPRIPSVLTERGRAQAGALGVLLADEPIALCVTSQLGRTIETAALALQGRSVPTRIEPGLNEPRAGALEGGPVSVYAERLYREGLASPNPGGESQLDALRRYVTGLRRVA